MLKSIDLYGQRNTLKLIVALNLLLVGTASLLYTNMLIERLEAREENYMQLFAKALAYTVESPMDADINFIVTEITNAKANDKVPTIYINETGAIADHKNIDFPDGSTAEEQRKILQEQLEDMKEEHAPIEVDIGHEQHGYIYYSNSTLLTRLRYFPYVQLAVLVVLGFLAYLAFSSARRAEQNRVWVGLAKETAHQLGTPLSSLMAWVEYFRTDPTMDQSVVDEIEKDVKRLETITARFSSIGSIPTLKNEELYETVEQFIGYLQKRISTKVKMRIENALPEGKTATINKLLFEWVIENICKNAVDAMGGVGSITIKLHQLNRRVRPGESAHKEIAIDITDTGKGISKANLQKVFTPGYSTKKRGWGLGLALAKRIIEEYHDGRLYVKHSEIGKGTTFRVILRETAVSEQSRAVAEA